MVEEWGEKEDQNENVALNETDDQGFGVPLVVDVESNLEVVLFVIDLDVEGVYFVSGIGFGTHLQLGIKIGCLRRVAVCDQLYDFDHSDSDGLQFVVLVVIDPSVFVQGPDVVVVFVVAAEMGPGVVLEFVVVAEMSPGVVQEFAEMNPDVVGLFVVVVLMGLAVVVAGMDPGVVVVAEMDSGVVVVFVVAVEHQAVGYHMMFVVGGAEMSPGTHLCLCLNLDWQMKLNVVVVVVAEIKPGIHL